MRMMKLSRANQEKLGTVEDGNGAVRLSSNNISHAGEPMSKFLDRMYQIRKSDEEPLPPVKRDPVDDTITDSAHSWSSAKTEREIKRVDRRVSEIILNSNNSELDNKEILDGRIDYEGKIHFTLGDAIRDQVKDLHKKIDEDVMKEIHTGINVIKPGESKIAGATIYAKSMVTNGQDRNQIELDPIPGYSLMSASNGDFEKYAFLVVGVANGEKTRIFINQIIPGYTQIRLDLVYVRIDK